MKYRVVDNVKFLLSISLALTMFVRCCRGVKVLFGVSSEFCIICSLLSSLSMHADMGKAESKLPIGCGLCLARLQTVLLTMCFFYYPVFLNLGVKNFKLLYNFRTQSCLSTILHFLLNADPKGSLYNQVIRGITTK